MRNVPIELKQKLLKQFAGTALDAMPKIQITAKQASVNTLISEIIHEDITPNFGDVAIRQLAHDEEPSLAYAICIDNGIGKVYSRKMPALAESDWAFVFDIGTVKDVAIEFDGVWNINPKKRYYELFTEITPYIFYVDSTNNLYVQNWNDTSTKVLLAENASHISVCRGWKSTLDTGVDQGLIIGYLRSGKVYYRAYCQQANGEYIWETENEITQLGSNNSTLCVFRTNDFRVGFITESNGEMKYVLSHRTYAGQAMPPEYAKGWVQDARLWIDNIKFYYPVTNETARVNIDTPYVACYDKDTEDLTATTFQRIGKREIIIGFNRTVGGRTNVFHKYFTSFPNKSVLGTEFVGGKLRIELAEDLPLSVPYEMTISKCHEAWQYIGDQKMPIEPMTITVPGDPIQTIHRETADITITGAQIRLDGKVMNYGFLRESAMAEPTGVTITLVPIGIVPI